VFDVGDYIISNTNLKYCYDSFIPIFAEILPIAIAAIERIYGRGSHKAVLSPTITIFK
jgi:hypothetical protein